MYHLGMPRATLIAAVIALVSCAMSCHTAAAQVTPNPIQAENALPGTTAWKEARAGGDISLYSSQASVAPGELMAVHVSTPYRYRLVVYRVGWYGGTGARFVACVPTCDSDEQGRSQPIPPVPDGPAATAPPIRASWPVTDSIQTATTWTSGYYLIEALLTSGPDAGRAGTTFVILRPPDQPVGSRILVQVPINTWQAYNRWGGKSLYDFYGPRAYRVSFDRPYGQMANTPAWWEFQLVRFLEREGYDVSYQTDHDTHVDGASLLEHRLVIVGGHDEYWTSEIRDAFDTALARGTNLAFTGSNDAYWRIKYEDDGRTIFGYKSLYDPTPNVADKTALFREIGRPECMLMGVLHQSLSPLPNLLDYKVTDAGAADPWLAGTGLHTGDTIAGVVGREHDVINPYPESCFHPGLTVLFHYDGHGVDVNGDAVRFTAPSGARVFASGAQQFTWALDDYRSDGSLFPEPPVEPWKGVPADSRVQQFMRNALDDLTRPAPPGPVTVSTRGSRIRVSVPSTVDPRVIGFVAAARVHGRWVKLCKGVRTCTAVWSGADTPTVGIVDIDRWHRHSAAAYAAATSQP
jgi:hypothetical protein